ncbi:MAG: VPLPA-CTERM sorting domain-containing protein [Gammaproteobacteria bacterium]
MRIRRPSPWRTIATTLIVAIAAAGAARAAPVIADSQADFSGVQGQNGWYYGYFTEIGNDSTFTQLIHYISDSSTTSNPHWRISTFFQPYTYLWSYGGHPQGPNTTVRRWASTVAGAVLLTGHIADADINGGNGIVANIYLDGTPLLTWEGSGTDSIGIDFSIPLTLGIGSVLDFEIADKGDYLFDSTYFYATISAVPLPPGILLLGSAAACLAGLRRRPSAAPAIA